MSKRKDGVTCTAKSHASQKRCKNPPMIGGTVCRFHGGKAPQVIAASGRRILEDLVGPALIRMHDILTDKDTQPAVRLAAVKDILDRTGYKPAQTVEIITIGAIEAEIARLEVELGL